jgi:hypothetical protein
MSSHTTFIEILRHTPPWVWGLLAALLALGYLQTRPRRVGLGRAALLPASMLAWSLWGVAASFGSAAALALWGLGVLGAAAATARLAPPAGARWVAATRSFDLPGSWVPLALIVALFAVKFGAGVSLALHPELRDEATFATGASLAFGAFSGVFAGRALGLLQLARPREGSIFAG